MEEAASADVYPSVASSALLPCRGITRDLRRGPKQRVHSPDRGAGESAVGPPPPGTQDVGERFRAAPEAGWIGALRRGGQPPAQASRRGSDTPGLSPFKRHLGKALNNEI